MPSRVTQLLQLLEEAKEKGDADKVKEIESDLFERRAKGGEIEEAEVVLVKGGGYTSDLL